MKESCFQFSDPYLIFLEYKDNINFDPNKLEDIKINFNNQTEKFSENKKATVTLNLEIGDNETNPFHINISMSSLFSWNDDFEEEIIKDFLEKNAIALLISYIRPIVASLTSSSRFPTFNLPFMDLT